VQLARALFAAVAAIMITFSSDHSAAVGLAVFSGYAIATAIVFFAAAWLVYPAGGRGLPVLLGVEALVAGMVTGIPPFGPPRCSSSSSSPGPSSRGDRARRRPSRPSRRRCERT
jgi:hypothetical protein